jgi:hypothetical protein
MQSLLAISMAFFIAFAVTDNVAAKRIHFAGYDFKIKEGDQLGPGPNDWARSQVFIDTKGRLHLKFSKKDGKWYCGEVSSISRFGFGTYQITYEGDISGIDKNVVFGFFLYPTSDVGADGTDEIDIEFSKWGNRYGDPLNDTVWPEDSSLGPTHRAFPFDENGNPSSHRFSWESDRVAYSSATQDDLGNEAHRTSWTFRPGNPTKRIGQDPMPVFFNLWGFQGQPPSDGNPVEVIISDFKFTPAN